MPRHAGVLTTAPPTRFGALPNDHREHRHVRSGEDPSSADRRAARGGGESPAARPVPLQRLLVGRRVLVVDDDAGVCNSLRDVLREEHCRVFTANGGLEALKVVAEQPVDVVLSDVVMPDMDGYDLYMELKERSPQIPVVLMTAYYYDKDHVIKRSRLEGLDQVIFKKPIDPKRLKTILEQVSKRTVPRP